MGLVPYAELDCRGSKLRVSYEVGKILQCNQRTSLSISGGTTTTDSSGNVSTTPIRANETQHCQLFVQIDNKELELNLVNSDVGFRPDHWVTIVTMSDKMKSYNIGILNHNTLRYEVLDYYVGDFVPGYPKPHTLMRSVLWCAVFGSCANRYTLLLGFLILCVLAVWAMMRLVSRRRWNSARKSLTINIGNILARMGETVRSGAWRPPF